MGKAMHTGIRRIICATDLSGNCGHMYKCALNLAADRGAGLLIVHVVSQRSIKAAKMLAYYLNEVQRDVVREKTYSALQHMEKELGSFLKKEIKDHPEYPGLIEHLLVYVGNIAEEIVEKANRFGCEAIVLGDHGSGFLPVLFPWGTVKQVIKQTKKPVFLVSFKNGRIRVATDNQLTS
jgi:nucleotide-binding universal stress UspA family protein